ncbi:polysaccharide pyruvyl transferase CsaB [Alkalicoccus chagannorensis]|uniref:polysaccharide pyruvyl transferase CsaB n=1 Tax=Alkalicoccus chagannorensis TaxID=427072 RepID=UPI0003FD1F9C|nr:polysaccharide pyruvyl transferase CsaB [Alkalicoccus chagannorensis]
MNSIVLSGYFGFQNTGDEAILASLIQQIQRVAGNAEITVLSNDPEETRRTHGVQAVNRWKFGEVYQALRGADRLISGGGSLFQDQTGPKSVVYYGGVIKLARLAGTPVTVFAQGIGPLNSRASRAAVKNVMQRTDDIYVRDEASRQLLKDIGVTKEVNVVPDAVFAWEPSIPAASYEAPYVAVSVRDWPKADRHLQKTAETLDALIDEGHRIVFVPMHGEADAKASAKVISYMHHTGTEQGPFIADAGMTTEETWSIIGHADMLIGMRLHALIFAAAAGVPFTALSYDPKIDALAAAAGQPVAAHVEASDWTAEDLTAAVLYGLDHAAQRRKALEAFKEKEKAASQSALQGLLS